jgi:hypothetical protein
MMKKGHVITVLRTKLVGQQLVYAVTAVSASTRASQLALKYQGTLGYQPPVIRFTTTQYPKEMYE